MINNSNLVNTPIFFMPSSLPKYSGLITEHQLTILSQFLSKHEGLSKARALGALLEAWNEAGQPNLDLTKLDIKSQTIDEIVAREVQHYLQANLPDLVSNLVSTQFQDYVAPFPLLNKNLDDNNTLVKNLDKNLDDDNTLVDNLDKNLDDDNILVDNLDKNLDDDNTLVDNLDKNLDDNNTLVDNLDKNLDDNNILVDNLDKNLDDDNTLGNKLDYSLISHSEMIESPTTEKLNSKRNKKLKPLTSEFLALPTGKLTASKILNALKIKDGGYLSKVANKDIEANFENFWEYLKCDKSEKGRAVWTKIK